MSDKENLDFVSARLEAIRRIYQSPNNNIPIDTTSKLKKLKKGIKKNKRWVIF